MSSFDDMPAVVMLREDFTELKLERDFELLSAIAQYFLTGKRPEYLEFFIRQEGADF